MRLQLCAGACVIGFVLSFSPSAFPQDAIQLFRKMQEALGGADRIAGIHDFEEAVRADAWRGPSARCARGPAGSGPIFSPAGPSRPGRHLRPLLQRRFRVGNTAKTVADLAGGELKFAQHYLWAST